MPSRYDVIVIDLDGTLLGRDGTVSNADAQAVRDARDAGLEVVIATGRALVESRRPLNAIEHDGLVITAGGSMTCRADTGRTVDRSAMPVELVHEITAALVEEGHKVLLLKDPDAADYDYLAVGPGELDPASEWWFETLPVRVRFAHDVIDDPNPGDTVRVGSVASEGELAPIARSLIAKLDGRAFLQHWGAVTSTAATGSETHLLEAFNPQVNKWTAIARHCAQRGIPSERVAAIGDGLNDVEIVREVGLGVAMGNADERVRAVADRVTKDHDAEGVAAAIAMILTGRW